MHPMLLLVLAMAVVPVEAKYMPSNYEVAIHLDAVRFKKNIAALGAPTDKWTAKLRDEDKVDLNKIAQVTAVLKMFPSGNVAFSPTMVVRHLEADAKAELPKWLKSTGEVEIVGLKAFKAEKQMAGVDIYGTLIGESTSIIAMEPTFREVFGERSKPGDLAKLFGEADLKHDLVVCVANRPLIETLKAMNPGPGQARSEDGRALWSAAQKITTAMMTVNLKDEILVKAVFTVEAAADVDAVKVSLEKMLGALPDLQKMLKGQLPPAEDKLLERVLAAVIDEGKLTAEGSTVTMIVKRPADFGK
jgi:hypothetical protein